MTRRRRDLTAAEFKRALARNNFAPYAAPKDSGLLYYFADLDNPGWKYPGRVLIGGRLRRRDTLVYIIDCRRRLNMAKKLKPTPLEWAASL